MQYCKDVVHVVQPGDTFYRLAQFYRTTVPAIAARNPGVNPYNLPMGTKLTICAGTGHDRARDEVQLSNDMRKAWTRHVYWLRMFLTSVAGGLDDVADVTAVLMENPREIAGVFGQFYPKKSVNRLERLLQEHLEIGIQIIKALKDGENAVAEDLTLQWYANADAIAALLSSISDAYEEEELRKMFYDHLDMTARQAQARLQGDYRGDIRAFQEGEDGILTLSDYLSDGIMRQFY